MADGERKRKKKNHMVLVFGLGREARAHEFVCVRGVGWIGVKAEGTYEKREKDGRGWGEQSSLSEIAPNGRKRPNSRHTVLPIPGRIECRRRRAL
jgi:hypothetical protein